MLKFKLSSHRPSFTRGHTSAFSKLSGYADLNFTTDKYRVSDEGIPLEYAMEIVGDKDAKSIVCWDPLGEKAHVILPRLPKPTQRTALNQTIRDLGLEFCTQVIEEVEIDTDEDEFYLSKRSILKPALGSNSIGVVLMDPGTHKVDTYVNLAEGLYLTHHPEEPRGRNIDGIVRGKFTREDYLPIAEEYRLVMFPDGEHYISKRSLVKNIQGITLPKVRAGEVHQLNQYALPEKVMSDLTKLVEKLDIYGYSVDLYLTEDGEWGIFEYSPEYTLKSATNVVAELVKKKQLTHYLDRLPPRSTTINANALVIRAWREELNCSPSDIAERLGMTEELYLDRFENLHAQTYWDFINPLLHILGRQEHELKDMSDAAHRTLYSAERSGFRKAKVEAKIGHMLLDYLSHKGSLICHLQPKKISK